jgi:neopullulanase
MKYILSLLLVFCTVAHSTAQIDHVEPPNWWVGMKNPFVQILINGKDIGHTIPIINYPGVSIKKVTKGDGNNYLFIDVLIAKNAKPGAVSINFMRSNKVVATHNYTLQARLQAAAQYQGFGSADVIYLLVPDRFANGDTTNDIVAGMKETKINRSFPGGRHGGDIRGIINHLDYIKDMGFTAIWPTPLLENDMPAYSYHGYAITNHYKVDPRFGTLDDYKELSAKSKQKGIKLIFDEVLNHTGTGYWWMNDLPFKNWLNKPDSLVLTNHRRTVNQDIYAAAYDKDLMTHGWFDKTMPDMNGQNAYMANYLIQNTIWWIETLQLGGVRQDTYGYSDKTFLKKWSCAILNEYPNFSTVGEEWSVNPLITAYWQKGNNNKDGYKSCLTTTMDFPLQAALVAALKEPDDQNFGSGLPKLYEALANDIVYADPNNCMLLGDNHDMDRLYMQLNQDVAATKMAITYLLTIRGIPQIYYGTEIVMDNTGHHKNDGLIRADFPGGWKSDTVNAFTGAALQPIQKDMQAYMKEVLNWRKNNSVFVNGKTLHFAPFNGLYVYFRFNAKKMVMVVMNKNASVIDVSLNRFAEILSNKTSAENILTHQKYLLKDILSFAPKTTTVLEIE